MTTDLEEAVRHALTVDAPRTSPVFDWNTIRARARRRTMVRRAAVAAVGSTTAAALALTTPWAGAPVVVGPATTVPLESAQPGAEPTPGQATLELAPSIVRNALTFERDVQPEWSAGPAVRGTIERALGTLMASPHLTDLTAQPQVVWSSGGHVTIPEQGPLIVVAVEQPSGWVLGLWDEDAPVDDAGGPMWFGAMPGGPLDDRLVGVVLQHRVPAGVPDQVVVYVPPAATSRVVRVDTGADAAALQVTAGTETDIDAHFGDASFFDAVTLRAYATDGTLLDEEVYARDR